MPGSLNFSALVARSGDRRCIRTCSIAVRMYKGRR